VSPGRVPHQSDRVPTAAGRVLFVEDEAPFRQFAGGYLEESGFQVTYAGDGARALMAFAECKPDLVLLDLNLPDLHGVEILRRFRAVWVRIVPAGPN